jgi:DNA-binding FadR family transcriptional regulator
MIEQAQRSPEATVDERDTRTPIKLARASQVVAAQLRSMILFGELSTAQRLPPEAQFAEELGISRHHLREALRLLEQDGLITIRRGHSGGVFLTDPDVDVLARTFEGILARQGTLLADLMAARRTIEPPAAELAARHATPEDLARLESILDRQEQFDAYDPALSIEFHVEVTVAAHNQTLLLMMRSISQLVRNIDEVAGEPDLLRQSVAAHRAILRALQARDGEQAGRRMSRHLTGFEQRLRERGMDPAEITLVDALRLANQARSRRTESRAHNGRGLSERS